MCIMNCSGTAEGAGAVAGAVCSVSVQCAGCSVMPVEGKDLALQIRQILLNCSFSF